MPCREHQWTIALTISSNEISTSSVPSPFRMGGRKRHFSCRPAGTSGPQLAEGGGELVGVQRPIGVFVEEGGEKFDRGFVLAGGGGELIEIKLAVFVLVEAGDKLFGVVNLKRGFFLVLLADSGSRLTGGDAAKNPL